MSFLLLRYLQVIKDIHYDGRGGPCCHLLIFLIPFLSAVLSSCAVIPQPKVGLKEFVHGLSSDIDCLRYCAIKADNETDTSFVLKYPLEVNVSVSNEGKINASPSPNLFSLVGLTLGANSQKAGTLSLRLHVLEHCEQAEISFKESPDRPGERGVTRFRNASLYYDIVNGREYLYVINSQTKENNITRHSTVTDFTRRFEFSHVDYVSCTNYKSEFATPPPGCLCPRDKKYKNKGKKDGKGLGHTQ